MPGEVSPRRRSRNSGIGVLFHRSQFDWPEHILSPLLTSFVQPTPNFFHHSHFDWQRMLSVPGVRAGRRPAGRGSDCRGRASFARCSPSLFHRSHFDWGTRVSSLLALGVTSAANHPWQLHRQIFFTECILTGGSAPRPPPSVLHPGGQLPRHGAHQLFLTNRTLTGSRASVLRRAIGQRHRRNPARGPITAFLASIGNRRLFGVMRPSRLCTKFFLTDHTLTGSRILRLSERHYGWTYS